MILLWIRWLYEVYYQNQFHLFLFTFVMWLLEIVAYILFPWDSADLEVLSYSTTQKNELLSHAMDEPQKPSYVNNKK